MTPHQKLDQVIQTANLFEHKEIMITVSESEKEELMDIIEPSDDLEGLIEYHALDAHAFKNMRSFIYLGVHVHLNVV